MDKINIKIKKIFNSIKLKLIENFICKEMILLIFKISFNIILLK
jgi:hypothetical protein